VTEIGQPIKKKISVGWPTNYNYWEKTASTLAFLGRKSRIKNVGETDELSFIKGVYMKFHIDQNHEEFVERAVEGLMGAMIMALGAAAMVVALVFVIAAPL
jgi:hypothetical protein